MLRDKWRQDEYELGWIGKKIRKKNQRRADIIGVNLHQLLAHNGDLYRVTNKYRERRGCGIYRAGHW